MVREFWLKLGVSRIAGLEAVNVTRRMTRTTSGGLMILRLVTVWFCNAGRCCSELSISYGSAIDALQRTGGACIFYMYHEHRMLLPLAISFTPTFKG